MSRARFALNLSFVLLASPGAHARLESSTALLLRAPAQAPSIEDLDRDVYRVRPKPARVRRPSAAIVVTEEAKAPDGPVAPPPITSPAPLAPTPSPPERTPASEDIPRSDDLTVRLSAGYLTADAHSDDPARERSTRGPAVGLGGTLWFTPNVGVRGEYLAAAAFGPHRADVERIDVGLRLRRSRDVHFGIGLHDSSVTFARAAGAEKDTRTVGLDLGLEVERAATPAYAHRFEVHARPLLTDRSLAAAIAVGGRYRFERAPSAFWRAEYVLERNSFAGATVTSGLAVLRLGAEWGA